ncbi:uncharacterized protein LOC134751968 [Cydia strobilella]|uniref:uncharacterized protein LOC134751968 n=1 Tax=Cydia strobilella TaxID=1100964 RepID=UPI003006BB89
MSELTVHSVCTKGPIYPILLYFQNNCDSGRQCIVLQDKNESRPRTIVMETPELVYAGKEEKEDSDITLILARDRISGNVRLIEVGSADLKPVTETYSDDLEHHYEAKAHSKMGSKKTKTQNISNNVLMIPPIDREITKDLEQQNKFKINLETESEQTDMGIMDQQDLTALKEHYSEEFHIPPIYRGATKVEDVYQIEKILSKEEYEKILQELQENNYATHLHPYIKSYMNVRHLSPQLTVLAVYTSYLIKYLHASKEPIGMSKIKICQHSKTLNDILMKKFTELAAIRPESVREKIICHIMVFMLILNNYRFYLEPLCTAMGIPKRFSIEQLVHFTGASVVTSEIGRQVLLRLPLVRKPHSTSDKSTVCEDTDSRKQLKEEKRLKISKDLVKQLVSKVQDETVTEKNKIVTANDTVNNDQSINGKPYSDDFYLPSINRDAAQVGHVEKTKDKNLEFEKKQLEKQKKLRINLETESEQTDRGVIDQQNLTALEENYSEEFHIPPINRGATKAEDVYHIEKILSKDEYEKILQELEENNYATHLHPYIKSYMKVRHLSPQLTVLAVYASYLIEYLHASKEQVRKSKFKICQHSKTLNDILIKKFTKLAVRPESVREKIICHIMVFMLILNNYRFYLEPLCTAMGIPKRFNIKELVHFTGASVVTSEIGRQVLLRLPLVNKPYSTSDKSTTEDTDSRKQLKEEKRLKVSKDRIKQLVSKVQDETVTEQIETVTANDMVNNDLSINGEPDSDDFYLPSINRDAAQVEHVYIVEKILSKDEYEQIYCEFMENNYTADLHPYVLPFIENETLSLQSTVLALYTSELLKFLHVGKGEIMKDDFILCHRSKTLNNIIMNRFTKLVMYKRTRLQDMKDKIVCHIIVFTLILSKFSFKLMPLFKSIKGNYNHMRKMIALIGASIINEDSEMTVQLKLPLVPKPQAPIRKPKPHKIEKNFVQHKDVYEIDPDEFYVPFLNREATNLEDVYVIKDIFSEDEYFQIFFELAENNYLGDLHPYIQQFVEDKTLSLEFTVLAVYASVLIKFLHASLSEIRNVNYKICHHSKTLNAILFERFIEHLHYKGRNFSEISRSRAMRRKVVCHIIVCTLILNNFQFKVDSFLDEIKREQIQEPLRKLVSFVAATIEIGDDGTMVKLKLPLVPKTRETIRRKKNAQIIRMDLKRKEGIDPDDFYLPTIDREATKLEDVYPVDEILSKDEYDTIHNELQLNNYKDNLLPYIQSFIENKTLSLQLTVLAAYANELLNFLKVYKNFRNPYFRITHLSNKLDDICKKRFIGETKMVENKAQDMKDKMVCHIIVCLLILNNFQFRLKKFCNEIKKTYKTKHVEKVVSLVGAVIVNGDKGSLVELKLPLVPKKEDIINKTSTRLTVDQDLTISDENVIDPDYDLLNTQNNMSGASKIDPLQHNVEKGSVEPETENVDVDQRDQSDNENMKDADDVYLPPINRKATKLQDVYPLEKFLSKNTYKKIERELKDNNYKEDLHPCIKSFVKKKSLSSELTVLAMCASSLIKYVHSLAREIKKANYRICPYSKTLNDILIKGFTELVKYQNNKKYKVNVRIKSANMKMKSVCHIMICMLILNNFHFKLDLLNDALKKTCGFRFMLESVRLVGAIIENRDGGTIVKLQLPSAPTQLPLKPLDRKIDLSKYDIVDPDDFYVPPINREATELENVYLMDKIFSKSKYKKIYCELEKSNYIEDLHPYIQSIIEDKSLSLQFTVLAVYASELIKFIHVPSLQIRKNDFKICHISKTLNNIIMKGFTEFSEYKSGGNNRKYILRISSPDMKGKMVCHVIACVLILNNFQCELDTLSDAVKHNKIIRNAQEMVRLVGASIVDGDNGKMVQLKLPLVPKTQITRRKQSTKIIKTARLSERRKNR